jgi:hypothetical protein
MPIAKQTRYGFGGEKAIVTLDVESQRKLREGINILANIFARQSVGLHLVGMA